MEGKYILAATIALYPASRGFIHVTSTDPHEHPNFDPGFLSHPADLMPLVWNYKFNREIVRRLPSYRGEVLSMHPPFPAESAAATHVAEEGDIATVCV